MKGRTLNDNDYRDLKFVLSRIKFPKCLKILIEYFERGDTLKKSIVNAHLVIDNLIKEKISPMLLKAYLTILKKNPKLVDDLSNYD